jgi:hypothetical protein
MRKFLYWCLALVLLGVGGMIGAYYLAKKYEEPVRNYIVGEVNKRLNAPVHVSDINFSLLERFPSASLVMDSVWAEESIIKIGAPDTLLFFEKVYLNLNLFDIFDGQYKINEIEARRGFIHLRVDEKGYDNFHIWKSNEDATGFLLELDKVHIEDGELEYVNLSREQDISLVANDLWFTGSFSQTDYTMAVKGDGLVHHLQLKGTNYLNERLVAVESELDIAAETETYSFRNGRLLIDDKLDFTIAGKFVGQGVDLRIVGNDLDIIRSMSLLPGESREIFREYSSSGVLDFDCILKGAFGKTENPRLNATFALANATISKQGTNWKLTDLTGSGSIDNGNERNSRSTKLILTGLTGKINGSPFESKFEVYNFQKPTIQGSAKLESDIQALDEFFNLEAIEYGVGKISVDARIATTLENPSQPVARDFLNSKASGKIVISNAEIRLKDDERDYQIENAAFRIQDNSLVIDEYKGKVNATEVLLSGMAQNFLDFLFTEDGVLGINGQIQTSSIDLQALFPKTNDEKREGSVIVDFPKRSVWNLTIVAEEFINGKFNAKEVSGQLVMDAYKVEAKSLHFLSQGGQVEGSAGVYKFGDNQFGLKTNFESQNVDVKQLFETFNNFEQSFIRSEHISGRATANVQFQGMCDSAFTINTKSIIASADLVINDGELMNFEPLLAVADAIKKKPMLRLFVSTDELKKRLATVKFATLENQISIRNGIISIPQMDIRSSAIDLSVSGTHTFNNEIDYAMDFSLNELLELKDRTEPYNEYVQRDQKGRTRIYLTMKGTTDDFEVELERTNIKTTLKDEMNSEKNTVKSLLKEEFKVFSADSTVNLPEEKKEVIGIEFDPEAGLNKPDTAVKKQTEAKNKSNIWNIIKKTESSKKKLGEGDFEDDDF